MAKDKNTKNGRGKAHDSKSSKKNDNVQSSKSENSSNKDK